MGPYFWLQGLPSIWKFLMGRENRSFLLNQRNQNIKYFLYLRKHRQPRKWVSRQKTLICMGRAAKRC